MATKPIVDFHLVLPEHFAIHERMLNWARWCHSTGGRTVTPMFRLYRCPDHWNTTALPDVVDSIDAQAIQKVMSQLPMKQRKALAWCYVIRTSPSKAIRELGVSMQGLSDLIWQGRVMLVNRGL